MTDGLPGRGREIPAAESREGLIWRSRWGLIALGLGLVGSFVALVVILERLAWLLVAVAPGAWLVPGSIAVLALVLLACSGQMARAGLQQLLGDGRYPRAGMRRCWILASVAILTGILVEALFGGSESSVTAMLLVQAIAGSVLWAATWSQRWGAALDPGAGRVRVRPVPLFVWLPAVSRLAGVLGMACYFILALDISIERYCQYPAFWLSVTSGMPAQVQTVTLLLLLVGLCHLLLLVVLGLPLWRWEALSVAARVPATTALACLVLLAVSQWIIWEPAGSLLNWLQDLAHLLLHALFPALVVYLGLSGHLRRAQQPLLETPATETEGCLVRELGLLDLLVPGDPLSRRSREAASLTRRERLEAGRRQAGTAVWPLQRSRVQASCFLLLVGWMSLWIALQLITTRPGGGWYGFGWAILVGSLTLGLGSALALSGSYRAIRIIRIGALVVVGTPVAMLPVLARVSPLLPVVAAAALPVLVVTLTPRYQRILLPGYEAGPGAPAGCPAVPAHLWFPELCRAAGGLGGAVLGVPALLLLALLPMVMAGIVAFPLFGGYGRSWEDAWRQEFLVAGVLYVILAGLAWLRVLWISSPGTSRSTYRPWEVRLLSTGLLLVGLALLQPLFCGLEHLGYPATAVTGAALTPALLLGLASLVATRQEARRLTPGQGP